VDQSKKLLLQLLRRAATDAGHWTYDDLCRLHRAIRDASLPACPELYSPWELTLAQGYAEPCSGVFRNAVKGDIGCTFSDVRFQVLKHYLRLKLRHLIQAEKLRTVFNNCLIQLILYNFLKTFFINEHAITCTLRGFAPC